MAFLAPPWADALGADTGLDLGRTKPPVGDIIDDFERVYPHAPILYVIEVHERLVPEPLAALRARFDWSKISTYDIAGPTGRHGVLLGNEPLTRFRRSIWGSPRSIPSEIPRGSGRRIRRWAVYIRPWCRVRASSPPQLPWRSSASSSRSG